METYTTSKFRRAFKKLPRRVKKRAKKREKVFRKNPFHPRLETHKLKGKYKKFWAFSVDRAHRIMFRFLNAAKDKAAFVNIGDHEIYR